MTDQAKVTVWQATWKPWGEPHAISGTIPNNTRFPGQYFQLETGLHYNWHRHYDPVTGRYTQPDPLRFIDGSSIYAYAGNSPYMYTDREGLDTFTAGLNGTLIIGGGIDLSFGGLINFGNPLTGECFDIGIYLGGSAGAGLDVSVGGEVGFSADSASSIDGLGVGASAGASFLSIGGSANLGGGDSYYTASAGIGLTPISGSITGGGTTSLTWQKLKSYFGGGNDCGCKK